jgi:hypothetical protein
MLINKLNSYQYDDIKKIGFITLNGRYSQSLKLQGTKKQCIDYIKNNKSLENHYDRFLIWKYNNKFFVTFGNN